MIESEDFEMFLLANRIIKENQYPINEIIARANNMQTKFIFNTTDGKFISRKRPYA